MRRIPHGFQMSLFTSWGHQYATRKTNKYRQEFSRHTFDHDDKNTFIDSLFEADSFSLNPPTDLCHSELCDILKQGSIVAPLVPGGTSTASRDQIYIDDRRSTLDEAVAGELDASLDWRGAVGKHELCTVQDFYNHITTTEVHHHSKKRLESTR